MYLNDKQELSVLISEIWDIKRFNGDVGIEVEVEGINLPHLNTQLWKTVADNSLKGGKEGCEYVLRQPVSIEKLYPLLVEFKQNFKDSLVDNSIYAGIHAHINVQTLTPKQLLTFLVSFFILEELLVKWCGNTRVGNHFCLRSSDAEYLIHFIRNIVLDNSLKDILGNDNIRYSAANLKSLGKYGSIEFRCLNSTIDPDRIYTWCSTLINILRMSKTFPTPDSVVMEFNRNGPEKWALKMLGEHSKKFLTDGWEDDIYEGLGRAQDIAFCREWSDKPNFNVFKKKLEMFSG